MREIKNVEAEHIDQLVKIHSDAFKGFFLTELGPEFLKLYYTSVSKHELGILQGCFENGILMGFSASTLHSRGFNKSLIRRNLLKFSLFGLKFLFLRSNILLRLVKNISKSGNAVVKDDGNYAELLSIGISSAQQGKGIGKDLLAHLEKNAQSKNVFTISLTTDFFNNDKAIGFYQSLGYEIFYDFVAYPQRKMYRMIKRLN